MARGRQARSEVRTKAEETGATGLKGPMTPHRGVPAPAGRERLAIVSARARCRLRHSLLRTFISVFFNQDISHSLTLSPHPLETPKHWPHPTWEHAAGAEWRLQAARLTVVTAAGPCLPGPTRRPNAVHRSGSTAGPLEKCPREDATLVSKARQHRGTEPPVGREGTLSGRRRDTLQ